MYLQVFPYSCPGKSIAGRDTQQLATSEQQHHPQEAAQAQPRCCPCTHHLCVPPKHSAGFAPVPSSLGPCPPPTARPVRRSPWGRLQSHHLHTQLNPAFRNEHRFIWIMVSFAENKDIIMRCSFGAERPFVVEWELMTWSDSSFNSLLVDKTSKHRFWSIVISSHFSLFMDGCKDTWASKIIHVCLHRQSQI